MKKIIDYCELCYKEEGKMVLNHMFICKKCSKKEKKKLHDRRKERKEIVRERTI